MFRNIYCDGHCSIEYPKYSDREVVPDDNVAEAQLESYKTPISDQKTHQEKVATASESVPEPVAGKFSSLELCSVCD